jgi:hypothetical protein
MVDSLVTAYVCLVLVGMPTVLVEVWRGNVRVPGYDVADKIGVTCLLVGYMAFAVAVQMMYRRIRPLEKVSSK